MKQLVFLLLFSLAGLQLNAQQNNYGVIKVKYPAIADSLSRINVRYNKVLEEINSLIGNKQYYYGSDGQSIDSLFRVKNLLEVQRQTIIRNHESQVSPDVHLEKISKYVNRAYALELAGLGCGIASGIFAGVGFSDNKSELKAVGFIFGAAAIGCFTGAYVYHFKSGKQLKMMGNSITYSF